MNPNERENAETQSEQTVASPEASRPNPLWQAGLVAGLFFGAALSVFFYSAILGLVLGCVGFGLQLLFARNN